MLVVIELPLRCGTVATYPQSGVQSVRKEEVWKKKRQNV